MNEFQLVFRGAGGDGDQMEYRFNDSHNEPRIDGRLVVDGETYAIRGVDWLVRKDDSPSRCRASSARLLSSRTRIAIRGTVDSRH